MEKPVQTTIHPDDVETLMRDFDKTPEPNPRMVEAHRKTREIFEQQPMSKPSEKAMQLARSIEVGCGGFSDNTASHAAAIDAHTAAELEARHRKTWALAAATYERRIKEKLGVTSRALNVVREEPCPPIEATKDK